VGCGGVGGFSNAVFSIKSGHKSSTIPYCPYKWFWMAQ